MHWRRPWGPKHVCKLSTHYYHMKNNNVYFLHTYILLLCFLYTGISLYDGLSRRFSTYEGSTQGGTTQSLDYSEGSWLDYSHSYPSRNYNAELSVTHVWQGRSIAATGTVHRGLPHSFLSQFHSQGLVNPWLWFGHLPKASPCWSSFSHRNEFRQDLNLGPRGSKSAT